MVLSLFLLTVFLLSIARVCRCAIHKYLLELADWMYEVLATLHYLPLPLGHDGWVAVKVLRGARVPKRG